MFNRYVDGLATTQPRDEAMYRERGTRIAREGHINKSHLDAPQAETGIDPSSDVYAVINSKLSS
jgi:hypothetical protein